MRAMKHSFLELNGYKISYYELGNRDKPTIVCLHGLAGSATYSFSELLNGLSKHFHLIAIDQPGHGRTSAFNKEEDYLFSNLASWYDKVLRQLVSKSFYVLGHSWGADVVLHFAKQYPANVRGVILLDGGFTFPEYQEKMTFSLAYNDWSNYMDHATFNSWEDVINECKHYTKRWNTLIEQSLLTIFSKKEKYELLVSKFTVLSIIKAFFEEPFSTTYPHIKRPLLLIHATEPGDLINARNRGISQLKNNIKDVSIISMSETGHMVQWDRPNEVAQEIIKWVKNKA